MPQNQTLFSLKENIQPKKSKIYFIPKSKGLGIIGLAEIILYLKLSGEFIDVRVGLSH